MRELGFALVRDYAIFNIGLESRIEANYSLCEIFSLYNKNQKERA